MIKVTYILLAAAPIIMAIAAGAQTYSKQWSFSRATKELWVFWVPASVFVSLAFCAMPYEFLPANGINGRELLSAGLGSTVVFTLVTYLTLHFTVCGVAGQEPPG